MQVHFIAIGGAAMHNIALALVKKGYTITGSDDEIFEPSKSRLHKAGILPAEEGWFPEKIHPGLDAIILGMHARKDNPELLKAQEYGLPIYSYPDFVFAQTQDKLRIVVGGSHGKTTITSMMMHGLKQNQVTFDYLVGSQIEGFETMAGFFEDSKIAVIEGDEYLASPIHPVPKFHLYAPDIAIISGIAWDHINVFPTFEHYVEQFRIFIQKIQPGGVLIYDQTDPVLAKIVAEDSRTDITKTGYQNPLYEVLEGAFPVTLSVEGKTYPLQIFGAHNLRNLEAARHAMIAAGLSGDAFLSVMKDFTGAARRLEKLKEETGYTAFKDFAHSPSKLKATVQAVREQYPGRKLVALMELHTFSSLDKKFLSEYAGSMDAADEAVVFYSQHTFQHKKLIPFMETEVKEGFQRENLLVIDQPELLRNYVAQLSRENCVLLLMSSGNWGGAALEEVV